MVVAAKKLKPVNKPGKKPGKKAVDKPFNQPAEESKREFSSTSYFMFVLLLAVAGVFLRFVFWKKSGILPFDDLYFYQGLAQAFLNRDWGHFRHFHFYPGYPIMMALMHKVFGLDFIDAGFWLNIIFGSFSVFPVCLIARELFGKRAGLFAAVFWSLSWPGISLGGDPEPVYGFLVFWGFYLVLRKNAGWKNYLSSIVLASFASLVKSESLLFILIFSLIYFLDKREAITRKLLVLAAAGAVYLVFSSPLWVNYYRETGHFNPNPKSKSLFFIHNPTAHYQLFLYGLRSDARGLYSYGQRVYIEGDKNAIPLSEWLFVRKNFGPLSGMYLRKLKYTVVTLLPLVWRQIFPGAFLLFLFYWARPRSQYAKAELWLWLWGIGFILALNVFEPWTRFLYALYPVAIIISAKGLDQTIFAFDWLAARFSLKTKTRKVLNWGLAGALILWFLGFNLEQAAKIKPNPEVESKFKTERKLAEWLKPRIDPGTKILCRGFPAPFTYFLGLPFWQMVITPVAEPDDIISYARFKRVRYIFVDKTDAAANPYVKKFLTGEAATAPLKLVSKNPEASEEDYPYALYELE